MLAHCLAVRNEHCWWFYAPLLAKQVKGKVLFQMYIFLLAVYFKPQQLQQFTSIITQQKKIQKTDMYLSIFRLLKILFIWKEERAERRARLFELADVCAF